MAKKSILERAKKRLFLVTKYQKIRETILELAKQENDTLKKMRLLHKIQQLPRNSSATRIKNRCWKTGRARGYLRFFGVCRNILRENAQKALFPGVSKSSW